MPNVYYQPENFNLTLIDQLDEVDLSYEYNTIILLLHILPPYQSDYYKLQYSYYL